MFQHSYVQFSVVKLTQFKYITKCGMDESLEFKEVFLDYDVSNDIVFI